MERRYSFIALLLTNSWLAFGFSTLSAKAEWTFLFYVQSNNSLSSFAYKNFNDMSTIGSQPHLNLLVQWYQPSHAGTWRYRIEKGRMRLESHFAEETDGNSSEELIEAMKWAVTKYPAKHYALVLWNHGIGILDPKWGDSAMIINGGKLAEFTQRIDIPGITQFVEHQPTSSTHRGILFNERTKTYMTNQALTKALKGIHDSVLNGNKIDLLGMDACLMGMLEVGFQVRPFANYLVTSQEVELAYGWNYYAFLQHLAQLHSRMDPEALARNIVATYENLYRNKIHFYTQSAFMLNRVEHVQESLEQVLLCIRNCKEFDETAMYNAIKKARKLCLQFSSPYYIDICSFYQELHNQLNTITEKKYRNTREAEFHKQIEELKKALLVAIKTVQDTIISNVAGKYLTKASGMSIYFPNNQKIDASYSRTDFAKKSSWLAFLKEILY